MITRLSLCALLLTGTAAYPQIKNIHATKKLTMDTVQQHKAAIIEFYEQTLNHRQLDKVGQLVSADYTNNLGVSGIPGFMAQLNSLLQTFPDAQWTIVSIAADGDKVFVKQQMTCTHQTPYLGMAPTHKALTNEGTGIYTFKNGKVISHEILTDRLGFLQQIGILPANITAPAKQEEVYFIDKFTVPAQAVAEFTERVNYNRNFIRQLEGFITDQVYQQQGENGQVSIVTVATWKNQGSLDNAKTRVLEEYNRIGFQPAAFYQRLGITIDRGVYQAGN
ncbi:SnoaL-like domain-containing protein [Chitinophaga sp. G-6-1-13]|uniref:SnoaL-like domain-containing protein n=1 Tax=Chitinophaga fulva TaxID=2728842 RepID=A0A848GDR7_9BACT|nr:ester cyclase [Chitinophaga fulva]NML36624.1 SnoaL-like domain-containing protein [Chitinophaga fulva]